MLRTLRYMAACLPAFVIGAPATPRTPTVLAAVRLPFTSSSSPAVGFVDGAGRPVVAVTSENIGDVTRARTDPRNVNEVLLLRWGPKGFGPAPGWPRHTPDATLGLAMADLDADGRDEVIAACGQDLPPAGVKAAGTWLVSRLYVWHGDGSTVPPWYPVNEDALEGLAYGHAYAAPVIADLNGDGALEVLQASQGEWFTDRFLYGSLRLYDTRGNLLARTQSDFESLPWYTLPGFAEDAPPAVGDLDGDGRPEVVAATFGGLLYAFTHDGRRMPGWYPAPGASTRTRQGSPVRGGTALADLDGDGRAEVLAGSYDGAVYCWNGRGRLLWRTVPSSGPAPPALTSGIAAGRLRRRSAEIDVAVGDAQGTVTVLSPNGGVRWRAQTTPGFPIEAEPAIGDVNGDGCQDVVVGGTDGYVYAFDGETGATLWQVPTYPAPTQEGMRLESVFGAPALCDVRGNGHLNVIVPSAQRYIADVPSHTWKGFGHVMVLDCGPGTYNTRKLDWPQYRQNARRTGSLPLERKPR